MTHEMNRCTHAMTNISCLGSVASYACDLHKLVSESIGASIIACDLCVFS